MSSIGNCYDNAVAESFFGLLKRDSGIIFDYIEVFYNRARRHQHIGNISPEAYEKQMA